MTLRLSYGPWGESLAEMCEAARAAEAAGAEVVWFAEMHRSALAQAAAAAHSTSTAGIGTAVALAFVRSPMTTALEALDIDEMAAGRLLLGLGSGVRRLNEDWHNATWGRPVGHLRETVGIIRHFIAAAGRGEPITIEGEWERVRIRGYRRPFPQARTTIPVYLAGMGPAMTRLAGEIGDGFISHELCSPAFLRHRLLPRLADGLAASGRTRASLDVVVSACCAIDDDPAQARRWAAGLVAFYASVRTYADFFAFHGFAAEQHQAAERLRGGANADEIGDAVPDSMVDALTLAGTGGDPAGAGAHHRADRRDVTGGGRMKPLQDVRIVSLEQYGAGPFGSLHLADLGAEVIKIEEPGAGGDVGRYVPPFAEGEDSLFFETFNRNKRSLSLDITTGAGRRVFEDLVACSDVVYSNLRGDVPAKMRITYEDLKHLNPAIVCCSLTGFGMTGPRSAQPGYDYILQGLAGWMSVTGEPDGPPAKTGLSLVDYSGGFVAALAILAGLHAARRDGTGMDCDVSLYDTAVSLLTYPATWHLSADWTPARTRHSAHPSLVPFQNFEAADGWLVVGCAKEKFWLRLTEVIGRPELAADPRFASFASRREHANVLLPLLEEIFRGRAVGQWLKLLYAAAIPCAPVNDVAAALADEHTIARGLVVETEHPRFGTVRQLASPVRVGAGRPEYRRAPARDGDREQILNDVLGYPGDVIAELARGGAFGGSSEETQ